MPDLDPGLAIVLVVAVGVVAMLGVAWRQRRTAQVRMTALREAASIELEVISTARTSAVLLGLLGPIIFAVPFVAMALGDWGRAHALAFVSGLIAVVFAVILGVMASPPAWVRVGRVTLGADAEGHDVLRLESHAERREIRLAEDWSLRESFVPPGQRTEVVVDVAQGARRITLRYPLLLGDEAWVNGLPVATPSGAVPVLGAEARVLHERLRERAGAGRRDRGEP